MAVDQVPIAWDAFEGGAFPALTTDFGFTAVRRVVPVLEDAALNAVVGVVHVPPHYLSGPKVVIRAATTPITGSYRIRVSTSAQANAEAADAALTAESYQNIAAPGTARLLKDATFTLTPTVAAGDTLTVKLERDGANAADDVAAATRVLVVEALFEFTY